MSCGPGSAWCGSQAILGFPASSSRICQRSPFNALYDHCSPYVDSSTGGYESSDELLTVYDRRLAVLVEVVASPVGFGKVFSASQCHSLLLIVSQVCLIALGRLQGVRSPGLLYTPAGASPSLLPILHSYDRVILDPIALKSRIE